MAEWGRPDGRSQVEDQRKKGQREAQRRCESAKRTRARSVWHRVSLKVLKREGTGQQGQEGRGTEAKIEKI